MLENSLSVLSLLIEIILATAVAGSNLIVCGVAGATLRQVQFASNYVMTETPFYVPKVGESATLVSITAACLSTPLTFLVAVVRLYQLRQPHLQKLAPSAIDYISVLVGVFVIAGFGAGGAVAAVSANAWYDYANFVGLLGDDVNHEVQLATNCKLHSFRAAHYLIATSVTVFFAFTVKTCFIIYQTTVRFWKSDDKYYEKCDTEVS